MAANEVSVSVYDHGTVVDKHKGRMKCNYCGKVVSGSSRLKCHLGGIRGDVSPCEEVLRTVKELIRNVLVDKKKWYLIKEVGELNHPNHPWKRNWCYLTLDAEQYNYSTSGFGGSKRVKVELISEKNGTKTIAFPNRMMEFQVAVGGNEDQSLWKAEKCIDRFFYGTNINFTAAIIPCFQRIIYSTLIEGQNHNKIHL